MLQPHSVYTPLSKIGIHYNPVDNPLYGIECNMGSLRFKFGQTSLYTPSFKLFTMSSKTLQLWFLVTILLIN